MDLKIIAGLALSLAVLAGCGDDADTPNPPEVAEPASNPSSAAPPATDDTSPAEITSACDLMTPDEVANVVGAGMLKSEERKVGIMKKESKCQYTEGDKMIADIGVKTGNTSLIGGPQDVVDLYVAGRQSSEAVDGLGEAAAYFRDDSMWDGVVFVERGASLQVVVESDEISKDDLIELARQLSERV